MRVIVADDSVLLREGLTLILSDEGHEVMAVGSGTELVPTALRLRPDLVISDIRMPPSNTDEGLRAALTIRESWPEAPILLLSQYVVTDYLRDLLDSGTGGGLGYLLKDRVSDIDSFLEAARRVAGGGLALDPEVVTRLMRRSRAADPLETLTAREREVLELMAEGHTNAVIAGRLFVTEGAVEKHSQRIFSKLGLHSDPAVHRRVKAVLTLLVGRE